VLEHQSTLKDAGELDERRRRQQVEWTWMMVHDELWRQVRESTAVRSLAPSLEEKVRSGELTATLAAEQLLKAFQTDPESSPGSDTA
jgi:LAO/AO transport system kinase